jgi:hypothetical protein
VIDLLIGLRCAFGRHRFGSPATIRQDEQGFASWPCLDCFTEQRLKGELATQVPGIALRLPGPDAEARIVCDRLEREHRELTARAIARNERAREAAQRGGPRRA